jgi:hypothetical protein
MPWSQTDFEGHPINFWEQNRLEGKVECVGAEDVSGPVFGGVRAAHRFLDLKSAGGPKPVLDETWDVKVYAFAPQYFLVDFTSVQKCAGSSPLRFRQHRYGGFGFRGSADWEGPAGCEFITSEGKTRKDGHGTSAWWCEVFGKVGGEVAGISFLCHPSNFRAPQNMRIHEAEPFFNYAPCQDGDFELAPGSSFISRYRLVLHDGALSVQELQRALAGLREAAQRGARRGGRPAVKPVLRALVTLLSLGGAIPAGAREPAATSGPFTYRGYYFILSRNPTYGLDDYRRIADRMADDGANIWILWIGGGFPSRRYPETWDYNREHRNVRENFAGKVIDHAHSRKIRVLLGLTPFAYDGVNRYGAAHPELGAT